jgi:hypothetical protein
LVEFLIHGLTIGNKHLVDDATAIEEDGQSNLDLRRLNATNLGYWEEGEHHSIDCD